MQRHDVEVFGFEAEDLLDLADAIHATALQETSYRNVNDGVRCGVPLRADRDYDENNQEEDND